MIQYLINLTMAFDQFLSTVLGGHPDDTVSQRLGRAKVAGYTHTEPLRIAIDFIFYMLLGEDNHCLRSLSGKSMAKEIWNWGGSRDLLKVEDD